MLAALSLAACGGEPAERVVVAADTPVPVALAYAPPEAPAAGPVTLRVAAPVAETEARLLKALSRLDGISIWQWTLGRQILLRYTGDPARFVDCGTLRIGAGNPPVPAATERLSIPASEVFPFGPVDRSLRADILGVMGLAQEGGSTVVTIEAIYVLSQQVDARAGDTEAVAGRNTRRVTFRSGETGTFPRGTTCRPNGAFESRVAEVVTTAGAGA